MLIAMGAAEGERWVAKLSKAWRLVVEIVFFQGIVVAGAYAIALVVAAATSGPLMHFALEQNEGLREEIGWNELVQHRRPIRDSLPPGQQAHLGITTGNYGEYGAIEILGPGLSLPQPIGTTNSDGCAAIPRRSRPPSSLSVFSRKRPTGSSPAAVSPDTTATLKALKTKRASTTPTSSSAALPANPGPSSGMSIATSAEALN